VTLSWREEAHLTGFQPAKLHEMVHGVAKLHPSID
jgi:hypothetical protein